MILSKVMVDFGMTVMVTASTESGRGGCDEAEVWMRRIPKLGSDVDATKPAWRFDAIEIRSVDSEAWMQGESDEAFMELNWESGAIAYSNEIRCHNSRFLVECKLVRSTTL